MPLTKNTDDHREEALLKAWAKLRATTPDFEDTKRGYDTFRIGFQSGWRAGKERVKNRMITFLQGVVLDV